MITAKLPSPIVEMSLLLRLVTSSVAALVITFSLFILMKVLISPPQDTLPPRLIDFPVVQLFEPPKETAPELRKPIPPIPEIVAPERLSNQFDPIDSSSSNTMGNFTPNLTVTLDGPARFAGVSDRMAAPIVRVEPRFPVEAMRQGLSGWVKLAFNINESGSVTDIRVIEAEPRNVFDREAIRALRRWKYQPQFVEGQPVKQMDLQVQLDFVLQQE